mmetsp:Transcript_9689/g.23834  ORF Transcript_9689/g.23834 Transcript_9689/m.23834 type:complete len:280 (-) Transcript_9689:212-1051(-)
MGIHGLLITYPWQVVYFLLHLLLGYQSMVATYIAFMITRASDILRGNREKRSFKRSFHGKMGVIAVSSLTILTILGLSTGVYKYQVGISVSICSFALAVTVSTMYMLVMLKRKLETLESIFTETARNALGEKITRLFYFVSLCGGTIIFVSASAAYFNLVDKNETYQDKYREYDQQYSFYNDYAEYGLIVLNFFFIYYSWVQDHSRRESFSQKEYFESFYSPLEEPAIDEYSEFDPYYNEIGIEQPEMTGRDDSEIKCTVEQLIPSTNSGVSPLMSIQE